MNEALLTTGSFSKDIVPEPFPPRIWINPDASEVGSSNISDLSANKWNITNSGVIVNTDSPNGKYKSLRFNPGIYNTLVLPPASISGILNSNFTLEFRVKPMSFNSGFAAIFGQWKQAVGQGGLMLAYNQNGILSLFYGPTNENAQILNIGQLAINSYVHIALVRDGDYFRSYVRGKLTNNFKAEAKRADLSVNAVFGAYYNPSGGIPQTGGAPLNAYLSNFKYFNYVKYTEEFTPN